MNALAPGQVIADRYLLVESIGEGAMGAVFRAEDQTLKRQVAIKFLFVRATRDPQQMVDQFLREARIAASVQHRNVIQTVDFGAVDQLQPFMVMELLSGESLGERLTREPSLTVEQLVHIVSLTLRGLAAVHDAGIVHRDLKPQNIFLQRDAEAVYPKILDFGISRSVDTSGQRPSAIATQEGLIVGTPDYMSPEQARGEAGIDSRSDIYSMGVILYEGLTGQPPFDANTIGELIVKIMTAEPPRVRELRPDVPLALSDLVAQAMSKDREQRFSDARAMRRALLAVAESAQPSSRRSNSGVPAARAGAGGAAPLEAGAVTTSKPPPVPAHLSAAPKAIGPVSSTVGTWGDFEGLNARQIIDNSLPPAAPQARVSAPPATPQQQRMVGEIGLDELSAMPRTSGAPQRPSAGAERVAAAPPSPSGGRRSRGSSGKNKAAGPALEALDPLYAGSEQAAPDIDYDRAGVSAKKPQLAAAAQAGSPARVSRARQKPLNQLPHERARRRIAWGTWLLPAIALLLLGYLLYRPSAGSPLPPAASVEAEAPSTAAAIAAGAADSDLRSVRLQDKPRRAQPGLAPPHMRDVVF